MPAEYSRALSSFVKNVLSFIFPASGPEDSGGEGHHLLRKLAHFAEFACLGMLLTWLTQMLRTTKWEYYVFPLLAGAMVACLDEIVQIFVPGRGPGILDVGIDTLGVILGIVLINGYVCIKCKIWRKIK